MIRLTAISILGIFLSSFAIANEAFGTRDEAKKLALDLIAIADAEGISAAAQAVNDPTQPFNTTRMGVNLFAGSIIVADNREPETVAADYNFVADRTGEIVWPRISAAAASLDDAILHWYHYDTQEYYIYKCFSASSRSTEVTVMVCR